MFIQLTPTCISILCLLIEQFSFECCKTKAKVITSTNHKKRKQHKGPIRIAAGAKHEKTCVTMS